MEFTQHYDFPYDMEEAWNDLLAHSASHVPFLRSEYLAEWWTTRGGGEWPDDAELAIITAHEDGRLIGIAPLFIAEHEEKVQLLLLGSIEISDYLDFICRIEDTERFCRKLLAYIKETFIETGRAMGVDLYNIVEDSPTLQALEDAAKATGVDFEDRKLQHSPYIALPADWETYLQNLDKKQRHEIRRKMRRAAELDVPASLHIVEDAAELDAEIESFLSLMAQDEAKVRFLTEPMRAQMRQTMRMAFTCGCLNLAFLQFGEEKAAAYLSFDYLNRVWVYNSGFNTKFFEHSPGWVLLGHMIQWAISNGREALDFMRGDEEYKYRFGAVDRHVVKATLIR